VGGMERVAGESFGPAARRVLWLPIRSACHLAVRACLTLRVCTRYGAHAIVWWVQVESPLLRSLKKLHKNLQGSDDVLDIDAVVYTRPFLDIITSEGTSALLTAIALSSLNKFLLYGFICPEAPRAQEAMNRIVLAATRCRFESIDKHDDETALMRLLELLSQCVRSSAGVLLTDDSVWLAMQCCNTMADAEKSSFLLRSTANATLSHIVLHMFSRLPAILAAEQAHERAAAAAALYHPRATALPAVIAEAGHQHVAHPYGVPVLTRTLSWLSARIGEAGADRGSTLAALELINTVLETGGTTLGAVPPIVAVCQTELCKYLIGVCRTQDIGILTTSLRVVFNLFHVMKQHLKVQLEVFFTSVYLHLAESAYVRCPPAAAATRAPRARHPCLPCAR
ncbi:hypothetical protein EON66_09240, partial [archaeon]